MDTAIDRNQHVPAIGRGRRGAHGDFQAAGRGSREGFRRKGRRGYRRFGRVCGGAGSGRRRGPGGRRHLCRQQPDHAAQGPEDLLWGGDPYGRRHPVYGLSHRPNGHGQDRVRRLGSDHPDAEERRQYGCHFADELRGIDRPEQPVWFVPRRDPGLHHRRQQGQPNRRPATASGYMAMAWR